MEYDDVNDVLKFSSGKKIYCSRNIIGINTEDLFIHYGYDDCHHVKEFTEEEKIELADEMIKRWEQFKGK